MSDALVRSPRPAARSRWLRRPAKPDRLRSARASSPSGAGHPWPGRASDSHFQIPRLRTLASHALPAMIESSFIPLGLFYLAMWAAGLWVALIVALLWSYGAILRRL